MSTLRSPGFPEDEVRRRALRGAAAIFPDPGGYGREMHGADAGPVKASDLLDRIRLVPPVLMPGRLDKLVDLGREPTPADVDLITDIGGTCSALPVYVSAFGSTRIAATGLGLTVARQAARCGIPMVVGENVAPVDGYRGCGSARRSLQEQLRAYAAELPDERGGIAVQQSTEDADAEVWNAVYSDPDLAPLVTSGRLVLELKLGQGAKPGLGGMTMIDAGEAARLDGVYTLDQFADGGVLRHGSAGTFTADILTQQVRLMRSNFPLARTWVKLPPGRDVAVAAGTAWAAGADAVTVDGAEAGSGWAPRGVLGHVGLPLGECLLRVGPPGGCLLASGRVWEGMRAVKCLALGARAVGLGRAALLAADTDAEHGLSRLLEALATEMRIVIHALGRYTAAAVDTDDLALADNVGRFSSPTAGTSAPAEYEETTA